MHGHGRSVDTDGRVIHWARFYDLLLKVVSLGREPGFRRRIIALAKIGRGEHVLDVGCGTGTLALAAAEAVGPGGRVSGIDPAVEMIARAQKKAAKTRAPAEFAVGVIEALPFADRSVDVVLSSLMFHHLPVHLRSLGLAEVARVLSPGGRFVLVDFGDAEPVVRELTDAGFRQIARHGSGVKFLFALTAATNPGTDG